MYRYFLLATSVLLFCFSFGVSAHAETFVNGDITTDTTWTVENSPYIVNNDFRVAEGTTLTINPGVVVKFSFGSGLEIDGKLIVQGTALQPVYFTSAFDYAFDPVLPGDDPPEPYVPEPGDWGGVYFGPQSQDSIITNLVLKGVDDGLVFDNTNAVINGLMVDHGNTGITANGSKLNVTDAIFQTTDEPLTAFNNSVVTAKNFSANEVSNSDGVVIFNNSQLIGNEITLTNISKSYQSGLVVFNDSRATIDNSIFSIGPADGVVLFNHGDVILSSTTLENWRGTAVNDIGSSVRDMCLITFRLIK